MLDAPTRSLRRVARARYIVLLFGVFVVFHAGVFPFAAERIDAEERHVAPLDLRFGYSPTTAYEAMTAYGAAGRRAYVWTELTADVVYPAVYALLLSLSALYLFERTRPASTFAPRLALLPFGALVADYVENVGIVVMLARYPTRSDALVRVTSAVTCLKWVLFAAAIGVVVAGVASFVLGRRRGGARS